MNVERSAWLPLGKVPAKSLAEANAQLHHAVQFIAMAGKYLLTEKKDDSNTSMKWDSESHSYIGELIRGPFPFRVAVQSLRFNLVLLDENMRRINELHLPGVTTGYAFAWLREQVAALDIEHGKLKKKLHYSIPEHTLDKCSPFRISNPEAFRELAKLRNNAQIMLNMLRKQFDDSSEVRTWPHHFDTACVIAKDQDETRTISPGLAIADETVNEPYFFVNVWTKEGIELPTEMHDLERGRWNREGWPGAVLPYSSVSEEEDPEVQRVLVSQFYKEASKYLYDILP